MVFKRKGSECSPKPYRFGLLGSEVRSRRYWDSKTRLAAEVSKSTSPVLARVIENENGEVLYLNWIFECLELIPLEADGLGRTDSGT